MEAIVVRSISREYRIRTESQELAAFLAFIEARPEIAGPPLTPIDLAADAVSQGFLLTLPGGTAVARSAVEAANRLHEIVFAGVIEEAPSAPLVHGASLVRNGQRLVIVGMKGAGKSTLTLHLLAHGFEVEGDEHLIVREADAIARPRRLRIKPGSLPFVPDLADAVARSPVVHDALTGGPIYAVDPAIAGRPWRIRPGDVDHFVFLERNHGGSSDFTSIAGNEGFALLAEHCLLPPARPALAASRLRRLASKARCWRLWLGDLNQAAARIHEALQKSHAGPLPLA